MRLAILFAAVVLSSGGCDLPASPQEGSTPHWPALPPGTRAIPFQPIDLMGGTISGFREPARLVIDNQKDWRSFWATYQAGQFPKTDPPNVDFERDQIVAGMMGQRTTGGYDISIAGIFESVDRIVVRVLEASPGRECAVIQVVTSPVTAATIPRSNLSVEFVDAGVTFSCN